MELVVEHDLDAFRARAEPFLLEREAENNLLFGILSSIVGGRWTEPFLATLERDGEVEAVAIRTPPHNLVLPAVHGDVARAFADALLDAGTEVPGVTGIAETARAFADRWVERAGSKAERTMAQRIYRLTRLNAVLPAPGGPRWGTAGDRALLAAWLGAFAREAGDEVLGTDEQQHLDRADWYLTNEHAGVLVWDDGGEIVSLAGHSGPTPNGMRIGPVYTPPERRRTGYATALVAELSARILATGRRFCFLYTDLANPTSNAIYQRIGYEPVCDSDMYRFTG